MKFTLKESDGLGQTLIGASAYGIIWGKEQIMERLIGDFNILLISQYFNTLTFDQAAISVSSLFEKQVVLFQFGI